MLHVESILPQKHATNAYFLFFLFCNFLFTLCAHHWKDQTRTEEIMYPFLGLLWQYTSDSALWTFSSTTRSFDRLDLNPHHYTPNYNSFFTFSMTGSFFASISDFLLIRPLFHQLIPVAKRKSRQIFPIPFLHFSHLSFCTQLTIYFLKTRARQRSSSKKSLLSLCRLRDVL